MIADCYANTPVKCLILKGILIALLLAGCAGKPLEPTATPDFTAAGKIGLKLSDQGFSANFSWQQYAAGYDIAVWGPLGQGRTRLIGDKEQMRVLRGRETLAVGPPEVVMQAHLGWAIPIQVFPAWIRGFPAQGYDVETPVLDDEGRLIEFRQEGWHIKLDRFTPIVSQVADVGLHPRRIVAQQGSNKVTVAVRQFRQ